MSDHNAETEYKGGSVSPPPGVPDTEKSEEIFSETGSKGYEKSEVKELDKKFKENFEKVPLANSSLTTLLQQLGLDVFTGETNTVEENMNENPSIQKQIESNIANCIKSDNAINNAMDSIKNVKSIIDKIKEVASKFVDINSAKGQEIINNVQNSLNISGSSNNSFDTSFISRLQSMNFLNFDKIDIESEITNNRNAISVTDPEAVITQGSLDSSIFIDKKKLEEFKSEYRTALNELISNLRGNPLNKQVNMSNSINELNISNQQLQSLSKAYSMSNEDFSSKRMNASDLPLDLRPR